MVICFCALVLVGSTLIGDANAGRINYEAIQADGIPCKNGLLENCEPPASNPLSRGCEKWERCRGGS
ncbi:Rapid ALkalinization Factor [Corchorus olitorius]|uniref:Rapid ALkalinization Factor n=1 Tax=Corchorus olitorius TaxID=93759 RepID=A0A1R3JMK2_9ROSI|nr:Rapid ALkalinization Factor [Corchorus olitorius]